MEDLNPDAVSSPLTQTSPAPDAASAPLASDTAAWIRALDQRYQRVYGSASAFSLGGWAVCVAIFFGLLGWSWALLLLVPTSFLMMMMVMRAAVHAKGKPLYAEAEARAPSEGGLDSLIATARGLTPSPQFFLTLVDGPLARHRRDQRRLAPPSGSP